MRAGRPSWLTPLRALSILALSTLCIACSRAPADSEQPKSAAAPVMAVSAARAMIASVSQRLSLMGVTAAMRHVALRAPCAGLVEGLELQSGDAVRRGQVVARVVNQEDLAAQAGLQIARQLNPGNSAPLADAVRQFATSPGVPVVVPQSAVVARRTVSSGQTVAYLDTLADLIDPASSYVEAAVPIGMAASLRPGMTVEITSPIAAGIEFPGRLAALAPNSDVNSATFAARIEFTGAPRIRIAGVAVEVNVITQYEPRAVVIPKTALFENASDRKYYVFTVDQHNVAHRVMVVPGIRDNSLVQMSSGLQPGETVITSGGYALSDGLKVKPTIASYPFSLPGGGASGVRPTLPDRSSING